MNLSVADEGRREVTILEVKATNAAQLSNEAELQGSGVKASVCPPIR